MIKVMPKMKLKGIRRAILEELGVQDICKARLFAVKGPKPSRPDSDDEEQKESGADGESKKGEDCSIANGEELLGEMASLETLGLQLGGQLEVEVYFTIEVQVQGKGLGYNNKVEVGPDENMDVIEERVSFFRMFKLRGFQIYAPELDRIFDISELTTT